MSRRMLLAAVAALALSTLIGSTGCGPPTCKDPTLCGGVVRDYRPLTTPAAVLDNLVITYQRHDQEAADKYKTLFDPNYYQFHYTDPQSPDPNIRLGWYYVEETSYTERLFLDPTVTLIKLTFPLADTMAWMASDVTSDPPGTRVITINAIDLEVKKGDTDYITHGSCDYYISPFVTGADTTWRMVRWEDHPAPPVQTAPALNPTDGDGAAPRQVSWAAIKSAFAAR